MTKSKFLKFTSLASYLFICVNTAQAGGIPVVDGAHITTNIQNQIQDWALTAERWTESVVQFNQDYQNQTQQLAAMTGVRDITGALSSIKTELSNVSDLQKWLTNTDTILTHGTDVLSSGLKSTFNRYGLTNVCNNLNEAQRKNCEGEIIITVVKEVQTEKDLASIQGRLNTINSLAQQMKTAKTAKESLDFSNQLQAQIALLNADKIALDIARNTESLAKEKAEKKRLEESEKILNNHNYELSIE